MNRICWIDFLRGFSMILILVFHTEVYYKEYDATPYYIYTTNAIVLFYFISGYLIYRQRELDFVKKTKSIIKTLIIPYFLFTTVIAVPKAILRQETINWADITIRILSGRASWFIAALIVAELIFTVLLIKTRGKTVWLSTSVAVSFIIYYIIPYNQHNYWQWQDALLAVCFLYSGYLYRQQQQLFHTINRPLYSLSLLLILISIKIYEYHANLPMRNIAVDSIPLFLADTVCWLLFVQSIIKYIPRCRMIEWTGQHCIVYYFLAGGCPLSISILFNKVGFSYNGYFYRYLIALILVYILSTILTWFIYKALPFLNK